MPGVEEIRARLDRYAGFLRAGPSNARLLGEVADLHIKLGEIEQARRMIDQVLAAHPDDPGLRFRLATAAIASAQPDDAIAILQTLIGAGVTDPAIHYNLAYALMLSGRIEEARDALLQIADTVPPLPQARLLLARVFHHLGDTAQGIAHIQRYLETTPDDPEALGVLALLQLDSESPNEAKAAAEKGAYMCETRHP